MGHLGQVVRAMSRNKGQLARYNQVIRITGANGRAMDVPFVFQNDAGMSVVRLIASTTRTK